MRTFVCFMCMLVNVNVHKYTQNVKQWETIEDLQMDMDYLLKLIRISPNLQNMWTGLLPSRILLCATVTTEEILKNPGLQVVRIGHITDPIWDDPSEYGLEVVFGYKYVEMTLEKEEIY